MNNVDYIEYIDHRDGTCPSMFGAKKVVVPVD